MSSSRKRNKVSILPSLITLGNLMCGFLAIAYVADGAAHPETHRLYYGAWLLFIAMVFDALDGKVARMTNSASDFGGQLDSLADIVTFGLAPAFMVKVILEQASYAPKLAWSLAALYVCCAALRLARFNVENDSHEEEAHEHFKGLPTPAAAGAIGSFAILYLHFAEIQASAALILPVWTILLAALMISNVRYVHMGQRLLRGQRSFRELAQVVFVLFALVLVPIHALAMLFGVYALSGPAGSLRRVLTVGDRAAAPQ